MKRGSASASLLTALACMLAGVLGLDASHTQAAAAAAVSYPPVTYARLTDAQSDSGWLTYYRTYNGQSHSPLTQIDPTNAKRLVTAWS